MFLILLMHALFGAVTPVSKTLLSYTTPIFFTGIRMTIAGILLLLLSHKMGHIQSKQFSLKNGLLFIYAQIILLGFYFTYMFRFWGLSQVPSSKAAFFLNTAPFITALYSYILDKEYLNKTQWLGLFLGLLGIVPILFISYSSNQKMEALCYVSWAEIAIIISVCFQCYGWLQVRRLTKREGHHPMLINGISFTIAGILALITSYCTEQSTHIEHLAYFALLLMIVILLNNLISQNIYSYLLMCNYSPTFLSFTSFLGPLFTAFYGWLLLNENISWHFAVAMLVILSGLYLFYREELEKNVSSYIKSKSV